MPDSFADSGRPSGKQTLINKGTIQYNHRWTQIDTDVDCSKPRFLMVETPSPDRAPKPSEARQAFSPQNLWPSVFICGSVLHGYGQCREWWNARMVTSQINSSHSAKNGVESCSIQAEMRQKPTV